MELLPLRLQHPMLRLGPRRSVPLQPVRVEHRVGRERRFGGAGDREAGLVEAVHNVCSWLAS